MTKEETLTLPPPNAPEETSHDKGFVAIPFSNTPFLSKGDLSLEKYVSNLKKVIEKHFSNELSEVLSEVKDRFDMLPCLKWQECQKAPGALFIFFLCSSLRIHEIDLFLRDMVSHWLILDSRLQILSSRNLTFYLSEKLKRPYYFVELLIHVEKEEQIPLIRRNLPRLADEIKLGTLSQGYAKHILEMKRLSAGGKTSYIYETIVNVMKKYPKNFEQDIFREIQHFLFLSREEFRSIRNMRHICRIICAHYFFQKALQQDVKTSPQKRHLYIKLLQTYLHYPFGLKKVLGMAIALNSLREYECFELRHITKATQRIIPGIKAIPDSFYSYRNEENRNLTLYFELEKTSEEDFSLEELQLLRRKLPGELKNSVEYLAPSLFVPRNEEELYRNIIVLSNELKYLHDLPQATISFQEQRYDVLKFNVTLLRILQPESKPLQELAKKLPTTDRFMQERVAEVGRLRKKHIKEANVFSIEIDSRLFLRKNHSVDLIRARQYVVKAIETLLGPFRDYNGGFLSKQNQQFEAIKKALGEDGKPHEYLLENLFYSLTPSIMQTLISPEAGKTLFSLFLKAIELELKKQSGFLLEIKEDKECVALIVKGEEGEIKEILNSTMKELALDSLKLASGSLEVENHYYICYLYLSPTLQQAKTFIDKIRGALNTWLQKQLNLQILHLHLPQAAQSLDPRIGADRTSGIVINMLFEGLMGIGEKGKLTSAIAKEYEVSEDQMRYTFHLKKTFWSNGTPLTAYDFEYAWKKILDPLFRSVYSFLLFVIKNAKKAKNGLCSLNEVGIKVIDDLTLVVDLEYPAPYFLGLTAHWTYSPLCREIDQRHPGWAYHNAETYVCNGPFKLDVWKLNDNVEVTKNPFYWHKEGVKLDKIKINVIEDHHKALGLFEKGELDWFGDPMTRIPIKTLHRLKKDPRLHSSQLDGLFWIHLNVEKTPFQSAKIRRACAYAVNRAALIKNILQSDDEPALGFYRNQNHAPHFLDGALEQAKILFEEGLKEIGLKKEEVPVIMITHSDHDEHELITKEVGRQWQEIFGIKVKYERIPWVNYIATLHRQDYMVGGATWYLRHEDPIYYLELLLKREEVARFTTWTHAEFNELIEKARYECNQIKRKFLIEQAEKIAIEEMPVIPLVFLKWRYLQNPRLQGAVLSEIGQIDFRSAYLEKK